MVGIDDLQLALPKCVLTIRNLAEALDLDVGKLEKGLGLRAMSIPDTDEDVITLAATALTDLLAKNPDIDPKRIGRIYVGTESMIDGSKPIASYLLGILNQYFTSQGKGTIRHCDTTDMVFACIGAVDAMQNSLFWLNQHPDQYAIVVSTDIAKYELGSPGEYTQGAGAVAMLLSANPRLLELNPTYGVSTECVHDFFKPHRYKVLPKNGIHEANPNVRLGAEIETVHSECPVFDGPLSNASYQNRMLEAYEHLSREKHGTSPVTNWDRVIFHQPYAYHGRRMFVPLFVEYLIAKGQWLSFCTKYEIGEHTEGKERIIRKSEEYQQYTNERIAPGERASMQVGNMYTGSIFLSLISTLAEAYRADQDLTNATFGFIAYGSGAKSKVFEGKVGAQWRTVMEQVDVARQLAERHEIDYNTYYLLHKGVLTERLAPTSPGVQLDAIGITPSNYGAREYVLQK